MILKQYLERESSAVWLALVLVLCPPRAASQPPPANSAQAQRPSAKARRVWTEDDVIALRRPSDLYMIAKEEREAREKAAREAAEAAKKAAATAREATGNSTPGEAQVPASETIPALEKRVADAQNNVTELERKLRQAGQARLVAGEVGQEAASQNVEKARQDLEAAREDLKQLEEKLRALRVASPAQSPSS